LKDALCDFVDADFGLLEELRSVLTDRQYEEMVECKSYKRNDKLMKIVNCLPEDRFLNALEATGQQHVVNFIRQQQSRQKGCVFLEVVSFCRIGLVMSGTVAVARV
jgi:hypothetical protein